MNELFKLNKPRLHYITSRVFEIILIIALISSFVLMHRSNSYSAVYMDAESVTNILFSSGTTGA
jgi:acyl-coenzyme A synthetase/AMP-(fatty) acid ligase